MQLKDRIFIIGGKFSHNLTEEYNPDTFELTYPKSDLNLTA